MFVCFSLYSGGISSLIVLVSTVVGYHVCVF